MKIRVENVNRLVSELREILSLGEVKIEAARELLTSESQPILLSREDLSYRLENVLGSGANDAVSYFESFLIQFATAVKEDRVSTNEVKEIIERELEARNLDELLRDFLSAWPSLEAMISSKAVRLVEKTTRLAFDHSDILRDVRILTDVRPVYDEEREEIERAIVVQMMRLDYSTNGKRASISLALDNADLIRLKKCADSAISKSESMKKLIELKADVPVHVPGLVNLREKE